MSRLPKKILFAVPFPSSVRDLLDPLAGVIGPFNLPVEDHIGEAEAAAVRVLVTMGTVRTDAGLMERLPKLGLICCFGSGYEGVDIGQARRRGIMVTHSPAVNAAAVADLAMALLLAANRRIVLVDKFIRDGLWQVHAASRMHRVRGLEGRRIGIYGYGAIGAKIAARAAGFDMEIAYHSRSQKSDAPYEYHPTLLSLAGWADVLMVAVRADASNRGVVDAGVLRALGPEGILINISRGSVVDETAMIGLLQSGELGSAGLDVFEHEPSVPEALRAMPHVVLTPHIGGATQQAMEAMQHLVHANITAFFADNRVLTPVPEMTR